MEKKVISIKNNKSKKEKLKERKNKLMKKEHALKVLKDMEISIKNGEINEIIVIGLDKDKAKLDVRANGLEPADMFGIMGGMFISRGKFSRTIN